MFTGTTCRVFPTEMKSSALFRAWFAGLEMLGVATHLSHLAVGWDGSCLTVDGPTGGATVAAAAFILACGGASWARLGSNGAWTQYLPDAVAAFAPANMGFQVNCLTICLLS